MSYSNISEGVDHTFDVMEFQNYKDQWSFIIKCAIVIILTASITNMLKMWFYSFYETKSVEHICEEEQIINSNIPSFETISKKKIYQKLPRYVRRSRGDALALSLKSTYVWKCSKCQVYLLNRETALKHTQCVARSVPISLQDILGKKENV